MKRFYIRPVPGRRSVDPHTRQELPAEGAWKPRTNFWMRRARSNGRCTPDVIEGPSGEGRILIVNAKTKVIELTQEPDPNITAELPVMEVSTDG